ncbi:hypothetical protein chiPu_0013543 [Chiloscyllium punctatum]|uniref:Uncharacterized protein n=1 Tax=Chiloscyllium punctatum TaxID=137246 RepID=A0A401SXE9_CHIPU|nr:hypothetical protein [Chiloscyllium punctatum]
MPWVVAGRRQRRVVGMGGGSWPDGGLSYRHVSETVGRGGGIGGSGDTKAGQVRPGPHSPCPPTPCGCRHL